MRDLLIGILLGVWITVLSALLEKYKMANYLVEIGFALVTLLLILLFLWPIILNKIHDKYPKLWLTINKMFVRRVADSDFWKRLEEQQNKNKRRSG